MLQTLVFLVIDGFLLMLLLHFLVGLKGDKQAFVKSLITAVVGAIAAMGLSTLLPANLFGLSAPQIAAIITAVCVGIVASYVFKIEMVTAIILGALFAVLSVGVKHFLGPMLPA